MKLTILFRDETREVNCDEAEMVDGALHVYDFPMKIVGYEDSAFDGKRTPIYEPDTRAKRLKQIWNMKNIIGVEMDNE